MRVHRSREHNVRSFNVKKFHIALRVKRKIWKEQVTMALTESFIARVSDYFLFRFLVGVPGVPL